MLYRRFGKTGLKLPVITFGAMRILPPLDEEKAHRLLASAFEKGINHFETARDYGTSEEILGRGLQAFPREEITITTKITPAQTADEFAKQIDEALVKLQTDYIDNLDIHGINNEELLKLTLKKNGSLEAARKARQEGKIKHIGFAAHTTCDTLIKTIETGEFASMNLHYYYTDQRNLKAVQLAAERDMGILIISPTDKGGMLQNPTKTLQDLCKPYSPITFNDLFCLSRPEITTISCGFTKESDFDDHLKATVCLKEEENQLKKEKQPLPPLRESIHLRLDLHQQKVLKTTHCTLCDKCLPCPENIPIPDILRLRNLSCAFGMTEFGKYRYRLIGNLGHWFAGKKAMWCTECNDCIPRCPEKLMIPALLKEAHQELYTGESKRMFGSWKDNLKVFGNSLLFHTPFLMKLLITIRKLRHRLKA